MRTDYPSVKEAARGSGSIPVLAQHTHNRPQSVPERAQELMQAGHYGWSEALKRAADERRK